MNNPRRLNYLELNARAVDSLAAVNKHIERCGEPLRALVELRVSQINGCAYCVDLHSQQARALGETQQRLDGVSVWQECPFFDDKERAAFAWADALTRLEHSRAPDDVYAKLEDFFTEDEIVDLTFVIATMNAWNRLAVGFRHVPEKRAAT